MKFYRFILKHKFQTLIAFAFCLFACHLNQEEADQVFTFTTLTDSLSKFESATIILKDTNGIVIDTLFKGAVTKNTNLKNLPAPHYHGGKVVIAIQGFMGSKSVYEISKKYDANTSKVDTTIVVLAFSPSAKIDSIVPPLIPTISSDSLIVKPDTVRLYLHGTSQKLTVALFPKSLKSIFKWRSSNALVVSVDDSGNVIPVSQGNTYVTVNDQADSSKLDSALIIVKKDTPKINVGSDTTIGIGKLFKLLPIVSQDFGTVVEYKWDLDGDGIYEDSSGFIKETTRTYNNAKNYLAKFYVKDSEGNDTVVTKKITVVNGPILQIISPKNDTYSTTNSIEIVWSVDGTLHKDSATLVEGRNTITRVSQDLNGATVSASVLVTLDTKPPKNPVAKNMTAIVITKNPAWSWTSGGEGSGVYKVRIDNQDMSLAKLISDTVFTSDSALTEGSHALFIQERDIAGNWSATTKINLRIDLTKPTTPVVTVTPSSPTNDRKPLWTWIKSELGTGFFRYSLDSAGFADTNGTSFQPSILLTEGIHSLRVQERDSAGNWSNIGNATVTIDTTGPNTPILDESHPFSPLASLKPTWKWASGGNGSGKFKTKLDAGVYSTFSIQTSFQPSADLSEGEHTLYVQEEDATGNASVESSRKIVAMKRGALGFTGFSQGPSKGLSFSFDKKGTEWIAFSDSGSGKVLKWNGSAWISPGPLGTTGITDNFVLTFNGDEVFVAYQEVLSGIRFIQVKKFNGSGSWQTVGNNIIDTTLFAYSGFSFAVNALGIPAVGYIKDGGKVLVQIYYPPFNNWGQSSNLSIGTSTDDGGDIGLVFSPTNELYLAFTDWGVRSGSPTIKKLVNNNEWIPVGANLIPDFSQSLDLKFNGSELWIALEKIPTTPVYKLSGDMWIQIGASSPHLPTGRTPSLGFSKTGIPFLAYTDNNYPGSASGIISVKTLINDQWEYVGTAQGFTSVGGAGELQLSISPLGIPFVGFIDAANSDKPTVNKFGFDP